MLFGAAIGCILTGIRVDFVVPSAFVFGEWNLLALTISGLVIVALDGGMGGFTYTLLGRPLKRLGEPACLYLAGIVTVTGYSADPLLVLPCIVHDAARELAGGQIWLVEIRIALFFSPII